MEIFKIAITGNVGRFDFMWDIVINQSQSYVLLVAAHRPKDFRGARRILNFMNQRVVRLFRHRKLSSRSRG